MAVITISRGTFTGGQALAECLAEKLRYQCLSREVILDAAASFGVSVEKFVEAMEKPPSVWERLTGERTEYLNYLRAALLERVLGDNLVYHGYAGHLLLAGVPHVIKVRAIADIETRVQTAMARHGLDRKDAVARVKRIDKERSEWMRFLFGVNWEDPRQYDIVVNVSRLGIADACDLVASMAAMKAFQPTPESTRAVMDLVLASRVWVTLAQNPETAGSNLKVTSEGGVVTITGTAVSWDVVDAISVVARSVEGVHEVRSDVGVNPLYATPI